MTRGRSPGTRSRRPSPGLRSAVPAAPEGRRQRDRRQGESQGDARACPPLCSSSHRDLRLGQCVLSATIEYVARHCAHRAVRVVRTRTGAASGRRRRPFREPQRLAEPLTVGVPPNPEELPCPARCASTARRRRRPADARPSGAPQRHDGGADRGLGRDRSPSSRRTARCGRSSSPARARPFCAGGDLSWMARATGSPVRGLGRCGGSGAGPAARPDAALLPDLAVHPRPRGAGDRRGERSRHRRRAVPRARLRPALRGARRRARDAVHRARDASRDGRVVPAARGGGAARGRARCCTPAGSYRGRGGGHRPGQRRARRRSGCWTRCWRSPEGRRPRRRSPCG